MKKLITLFAAIVTLTMLSFTSFATNVSGGIYVNTTWTLANSPYIVTDTVVVFPGVTLTIEHGVVVKFDNNMRLEIRQATLIAQGTITDSITFTSNSGLPSPGIWQSIYLNGPFHSQFNHCNFLYAYAGIYINNNPGDSVHIRNSNFKNNNYGLYSFTYGIKAYLDSCNITNNSTGIFSHEYGFINHCNVSHNQTGANLWGLSHIINSVIDSNSIEGLNITAWNDLIMNNAIRYNGIGIHDNAMGPAARITKNVISNNNTGILLEDWNDSIFCNKICSNTAYDLHYNATYTSNAAYCASNYWCTTDSSTTSAVVYDGYDNINLGLVNFMPIDNSNCYLTGCNLFISSTVVNATCANCPTGSATATVLNGFAPYTYTWYSSPLQNTQTATGLPSGWYTICVTDANGCSTCDSAFVDSTNCSGFSIATHSTNATCSSCTDGTAMVIVTGGTPPYHYTWYTLPIQTTDSISGLAQGTYGVCVTDNNGCTVCDSATVSIGNCSAHFNLAADTVPHHYTATNMASGVMPLTYLWSWGDGTYDSTAYPSHTYATTGFYTICLTITDNVGCTNTYCSSYYLLQPQTAMAYVNVVAPGNTVGIKDAKKDESIVIYPNPATSSSTISSTTKIQTIKVFNVLGEEIISVLPNNNQSTINSSQFAKGIYFVQITDDNKNVVNRKVVVQ